jgi:hypothetical protein
MMKANRQGAEEAGKKRQKTAAVQGRDERGGELFPSQAGVKPIEGQWATAAQLFAVTGMNDAALRNLANANNPNPATGAAWIPKPRLGKYEIAPTVRGAIAWLQHQIKSQNGLPDGYANIGDFCARTRFPRVMVEYALKHGCKCRDAANRISLMPFLEFYEPILGKIFSGGGMQIKGLEGFEELDSDMQLARLRKEQTKALEDERMVREGRLVDIDMVDELLWEKRDAPLRSELLAFSKMYAAQCNPKDPALAQKVLDGGVSSILKRLREKAPKKIKRQDAKDVKR